MILLRLLLLTALAVPLTAGAETPMERVKAYGRFVQQKDWAGVAGLFDTAALTEFRGITGITRNQYTQDTTLRLGYIFDPSLRRDSLEKLSDTALLAVFLDYQMEAMPVGWKIEYLKFDVVGEVMEGDTLCHVVARVLNRGDGKFGERMEVTTLVSRSGNWGLTLVGRIGRIAKSAVYTASTNMLHHISQD